MSNTVSRGENIVDKRQEIIEIATELIGSPTMRYVNGSPEIGETPEQGFNCSGFVRFVLKGAGLQIPPYIAYDGSVRETRHANELWDTYGVAVHDDKKLKGDLIFFSREGWWPTHVGIVLDNNHYIHAPGKDGGSVEIQPIVAEPIISPETRHRHIYTTNPIGFKTPVIPSVSPGYRIHQSILP
jgi:cell wall-associated NlpC family hydrolase